MGNMVVIDNLKFRYSNNVVFNGLSMSISNGSFTTIIGNNGSGKSTLVKLLAGVLESSGIVIDGKSVSDAFSEIGFVFDRFDDSLCSTVFERLSIYGSSNVNEISSILGITDLLDKTLDSLSCSYRQLVNFGCALVKKPKLLVLDEAFSMLDDVTRANMLMLLRRLNNSGVTIINFTHDIEESIYGDDILIINDGKVVIHDSKENVYRQEKLLRNLDFDLPFMVDLSNKLSYYDMLDEVIYNMDDMVNVLWK